MVVACCTIIFIFFMLMLRPMGLLMEEITFRECCMDSGEWARREQSSAYCSSKMC